MVNQASVLSARGIQNRFGSRTLHDGIDLEVARGEILGIAGGSGSGKSVFLRTLMGLHKPDAGQVLLEGRDVRAIAQAEKAALMGVLFQQGALFSSLTVAQNIELPLREHTGLPPEEQRRVAAMKLALSGLAPEDATKYPSELSGGMVKRASLARAVALDPRILFLDEPTSGLDPLTAEGIDELLARLNQGLGVTVVMVTHDLNTLFTVCSRVAILADAKLVVGTVGELMALDHPWIHEFLHGTRARGAATATGKH